MIKVFAVGRVIRGLVVFEKVLEVSYAENNSF